MGHLDWSRLSGKAFHLPAQGLPRTSCSPCKALQPVPCKEVNGGMPGHMLPFTQCLPCKWEHIAHPLVSRIGEYRYLISASFGTQTAGSNTGLGCTDRCAHMAAHMCVPRPLCSAQLQQLLGKTQQLPPGKRLINLQTKCCP